MFERYTDSARRVLFNAREHASRLGARAVLDDHLLLSLCSDAEIAIALLKGYQVRIDDLCQEVQADAEFERHSSATEEMPISDAVLNLLGAAVREADSLGVSYVGAEHLLLTLVGETNSRAGDRLRTRRVTVGQLRHDVTELLSRPMIVVANASAELDTIARLKELTRALAAAEPDGEQAMRIVNEMYLLLDRLRAQ